MKKIFFILITLVMISCGKDLPKGTILAWSPENSDFSTVNGKKTLKAPEGFTVCNLEEHSKDKNVPDLSGRFIMGTLDYETVNQGKGNFPDDKEVFPTTTELPHDGPHHVDKGDTKWCSGKEHTHWVKRLDCIPPYFSVVYIIKK